MPTAASRSRPCWSRRCAPTASAACTIAAAGATPARPIASPPSTARSANMAAMEHETLLQSAVDHHRAGRYGDAAELYRRVLEAEPRHPDALHLLGLAMGRLGDPDEALEL